MIVYVRFTSTTDAEDHPMLVDASKVSMVRGFTTDESVLLVDGRDEVVVGSFEETLTRLEAAWRVMREGGVVVRYIHADAFVEATKRGMADAALAAHENAIIQAVVVCGGKVDPRDGGDPNEVHERGIRNDTIEELAEAISELRP